MMMMMMMPSIWTTMQIDVHHPGPVESHHFKLSRKQDKTPSTAVQVSGQKMLWWVVKGWVPPTPNLLLQGHQHVGQRKRWSSRDRSLRPYLRFWVCNGRCGSLKNFHVFQKYSGASVTLLLVCPHYSAFMRMNLLNIWILAGIRWNQDFQLAGCVELVNLHSDDFHYDSSLRLGSPFSEDPDDLAAEESLGLCARGNTPRM